MAMWCPRCNQIHERGQRCPLRKGRPKHNKQYDDAEYRRNRRRALDRTQGRCARCGRLIADRDSRGEWRMREGGVHHIVNLKEGGGHATGNLAPLCDECHLFMHR